MLLDPYRHGGPMGAEFEAWYLAQPRHEMTAGDGSSPVTILAFYDYQCPACKASAQYYAPVIEQLSKRFPGSISLRHVDFPLDPECNPHVKREVHPAACEAAIAVRLAAERGDASAMVQWLWAHQTGLSAAAVHTAAREVGRVAGADKEYATVREEIRSDADFAASLGVRSVPAFLINGVKIGFVPRQNLELALKLELRRAGIVGSGLERE